MAGKVDIVALGELLIDFTEAGFSANGQKLFEQNPGGAPANLLTVASHFGFQTAFIGKIGKDMQGEFLKKSLQSEQIDTRALVEDENYFGSLSLTEEPSRSATLEALKEAKRHGALISYDPNYRARLWENEKTAVASMQSVIPVVDVMKVSEEELLLLTEEPDYEKAALKILKQGPRIVAVTLGEKGAMIATQQHCETVKATPVEKIIDTTGAGDCFWGGFLSKYLKYGKGIEVLSWEEIMQCAVMGNSVAGLCVQKRGGIPSVPNKEELSDIWSA